MKYLAYLATAALLAVSCSTYDEEASDEPVNATSERVVIVYMSGDNNLSSNAIEDLREMQEGARTLSKENKLLAFVDRSTSTPPCILDIGAGKTDTIEVFTKDFYASDPQQFHDIISRLVKRYPAESYGLVLWGHATGWLIEKDSVASPATARRRAYGCDTYGGSEAGGAMRWMNITQMARAMEGLPHMDFIFADCCCMMCAEVAYELRHYANLLIGSTAEIPAKGAPYHLLMEALFSKKTDFYKDIIDIYYDYYLQAYQTEEYTIKHSTSHLAGYSLPLSAVDLSQMDSLAAATRVILQQPGVTENAIAQASSLPYYYEELLPVMYDAGCTLQCCADSAAYTQWHAAMSKAVVYSRYSARWMSVFSELTQKMKANLFERFADSYAGLSMHLPLPVYDNSTSCDYNEQIRQLQWYQAVRPQ